jgi:hypothetical protein
MGRFAGPAHWRKLLRCNNVTQHDVRTITPEQVLALLFPEPAKSGGPGSSVTAFVQVRRAA